MSPSAPQNSASTDCFTEQRTILTASTRRCRVPDAWMFGLSSRTRRSGKLSSSSAISSPRRMRTMCPSRVISIALICPWCRPHRRRRRHPAPRSSPRYRLRSLRCQRARLDRRVLYRLFPLSRKAFQHVRARALLLALARGRIRGRARSAHGP